jgi:MFS family permease
MASTTMRPAAFTALSRLPRSVWLLGAVSLCNDSASELVYPLVPLYLAGVLGATPRVLGVVEGLAEATGAWLKLLSGALTDRRPTARPWLLAGYGLAAMARPLIGFARQWPTVALLRFADRLGKGLRTSPRDALLARLAPPDARGLAFGVHRAMDNAGAVIGPLLAAGALALHWPLRTVILWSAVPGLLTVLLAGAVREPQLPPAATAPASAPTASTRGESPASPWRLRSLPVGFRRFLGAYALFTLGNASSVFLLLRARELGLPAAQVPLLWGWVSLVAMVLSTPLSALSDRLGRERLILAGWLVYGACQLALALLASSGALLWLLFAGHGLHLAASEGAEKSLVADLVPPERLGAAYGWFNLTAGLLLFPASFLFGWLWQSAGVSTAFIGSALCAALGAALLAAAMMRARARDD